MMGVSRAPTSSGVRAQGSTAIPVPPIALPVVAVEPSPIAEPMPHAAAVIEADVPQAAPTVAFTGLPPAIAAAIAAAPPLARAVGPHLALPPYVPAPNLGDPAEAIETVRVEKLEMTELVEKYAALPVDRVAEIDAAPRAFDARKVGKVALRCAPWIGGVALVLMFVIGFLMFDGEGRDHSTTVKAPPAAANVVSALPAPPVARPADTATTDTKSEAATPAPAAQPDPTATTEAAAPAKATTEAAAAPTNPTDAPTPAAKATSRSTVVNPKPARSKPAPAAKTVATASAAKPATKALRGKLYIRSNKPAQIFLDGKSANATTPRQLRVSPGKHKVTLWDTASGKTLTQMVDVPADKVVAVSRKFD